MDTMNRVPVKMSEPNIFEVEEWLKKARKKRQLTKKKLQDCELEVINLSKKFEEMKAAYSAEELANGHAPIEIFQE